MTVISPELVKEYKKENLFPMIHSKHEKHEPAHLVVTKIKRKGKGAHTHQPDNQNLHPSQSEAKDQSSMNHRSHKSNSDVSKQEKSGVNKKSDQERPKISVMNGDPKPARKPNHGDQGTNQNSQGNSKPSKAQDTTITTDPLFATIRKAAKVATFVEKAGIQVRLHENLSKIKTKQLSLIAIANNKKSHIDLDQRFFHLLSYAVIGKNLDLIFCFYDGTQLRIAPQQWLTSANEELRKELVKNNYTFAYGSLDIKQFTQDLHSMSAYVYDTGKFVQFWMPYLPITSNN